MEPKILAFIRVSLVRQVEVPAELQKDLRAAMGAAGIPVPKSDARWQAALTALKVKPVPCTLLSIPPRSHSRYGSVSRGDKLSRSFGFHQRRGHRA